MLSSRLVDTTNKCSVIQRSLLDDLYPYSISIDGSKINYRDNTNSNENISYNKLNSIGSLARSSYSTINNNDMADVWMPVFIEDDTYMDYKILSDEGSYANGNSSLSTGRIGLENFLSFTPKFRSFSNAGPMSIDWILNRHNIPYAVYYGILCWIRRNGTSNLMTIGGASSSDITKFPKGSRLKHSSRPSDIFIKIDDNNLYLVNSQRYTITATAVTYPAEDTFIIQVGSLSNGSFSLATQVNKELWTPASTSTATENVDGFVINGLINNCKLWIPDGDCIFYYSSEAEKLASEIIGIPTNGFVSPCLTRSYTYIYRILTLDKPRSYGKKDLIEARCYRKLAHALSTSPFITEFAVRALDCAHVKGIVNTYITSTRLSTTITQEKTLLKTALKDISLYMQKTIETSSDTNNTGIYVDTRPSPYSLNNNLIANGNQLFTKLVGKYGANMLLTSAATISLNANILKDNAGVVITQAMDYYCAKTTTNTTIANTQKIVYDGTTIESVMSDTESRISIKNTLSGTESESISLYDIAKPDIDGNTATFVPKLLYKGYIESIYMNNGQYNPPNDTANYYKYAMKTASSLDRNDILLKSPEVFNGETYGPELDAMDMRLNIRDSDNLLLHDQYLEKQMSFFWQKLSGPDCEFIEDQGGFFNPTRPSNITANSRYIRLKIKTSGKYVLQCTINSPFGTFKKQKIVYVYDGADKIQKVADNITYLANPMLNKWYDENTQSWLDVPGIPATDPEFVAIPLNRDKLRVKCSKFNRIAISQVGRTFMPISTSFTIKELIGSLGTLAQKEVVKLDELYKFATKRGYTAATSANLSIRYNLESSTIAKISAIHIEKIRSNIAGCEQCFSLYEPKLRSNKTSTSTGNARADVIRYSRINKYPEFFSIYNYAGVTGPGTITGREAGIISYGYPAISTSNSPPVKTYGGYNPNTITSFGINHDMRTFYDSPIPGLTPPTPNAADTKSIAAGSPVILPPVSGFPLDATHSTISSKHKLCYQKSIPYSGGIISFQKGVLHPNSGWIPYSGTDYAIHANRSSVLKFNPGARSSFSFVGPRISNIGALSANIPSGWIEPNTLSSSIGLKIAPGVQWGPICGCDAASTAPPLELYNNNQKHKEYIDTSTHISSHGYRYLKGGEPKPIERTALTNEPTFNDEFGTDQDNDMFTYSFAVTGPASVPTGVIGADGKINLRIPTVQNFGIKDIEVKLNFLNYVNTKNLVIWLEVQPDGTESRSRRADSSGRFPSPIRVGNKFIDQSIPTSMVSGVSYQRGTTQTSDLYANLGNNKVAKYLESLIASENDSGGGPLKILLMNQEHIDNNGYNLSIKFSDSASKYNVLYDQNINITSPASPQPKLAPIDKLQNIVRTNGTVRPSLAANFHSDREACRMSKILRTNRLNTASATFSKFLTTTLFRNSPPEEGPCNGSERLPKQKEGDLNGITVFTLKIMVLDETDDMSPNDTLISNQYLTGLSSASKTQTSTDIFNSLCNWELILHVGDVQKFVPYTNPNLSSYGNCDNLSLLDYTKGLAYPGYSFIADLTNYLHLLPLANIDAPNIGIADTSLCLTNKNDAIGTGFVVKPTEFPAYAVVQILASLIPSTTGTLIGTAVGPGIGYDQGFNSIISFLSETRFIGTLQDSGRQIYSPGYTKYPFGSPEKILLNVRKPGSLWYSLEAFIMKYHNTPILQPKVHNYIKVQRGISKYSTEFIFDTVGNYDDLIDTKNIPDITFACTDIFSFNRANTYPMTHRGQLINYGDIVNVTVTGSCGSSYNGMYVTLDSSWEKISATNINPISSGVSILEYNSILSYNNNLFTNSLDTAISGSKVIMCKTRVPYDIFFVNDNVECFPAIDRLESSSSNIIQPKILKKALINKNNMLYSVFVLDTAITSQDRISATSGSNTLLLYTNNQTVDNGIKRDYNKWGLDSNGYIKETPPYAGFSAHSVGSYGNVSPFVNKNLLDRNFRYNALESTHSILNNHNNDKIKYNKITLYNADSQRTPITSFTNNIACGFSYNEDDLYDTSIYQTKTKNVVVDRENVRQVGGDDGDLSSNLLNQIKGSTGYNDTNYSFLYVRSSTVTTGNATAIPLSGCVSIENDYQEFIPFKFIDITDIVSRLDTIDTMKIQTSLENMVGDASQTTTILNSSNIKYISKHLNRLIVDDPSSCHRPGANINNCPKMKTQNKLNKLYNERADLIALLDQQAVASASVTYQNDSGNNSTVTGEIESETTEYIVIRGSSSNTKILKSNIVNTDTEYGLTKTYTRKDNLTSGHRYKLSADLLPKIEPIVSGNTDGSLDILYTPVNLNHYWINIDPKQSCILDFASNPKVLESTEYQCIRANESLLGNFGVTIAADNNVCPEFALREGVPQFPGQAIGDEGFSSTGRQYKYWVPFTKIEQKKASYRSEYPAITGWKTFTKERFFNVNADESLSFEGLGTEITVQSIETYSVPVVSGTYGTDFSADSSLVPGMSACQTDFGSPAGSGLLGPDYTGGRVGKSTRVQNIFNLDTINTIEVQVKRIPRMLRGCDLLSTIYRYGNRSIFRQQSTANPKVPFEVDLIGLSGPLNNSIYCWICLEHSITDNKLKYATLPSFMQHQNEMIFRSFFGSIDRIENRDDLMVSYYPWELIPYEY